MGKIIKNDELKAIEVEILKNVAKFCEENGLTYYLAYGTLLGAVRHGGFIPWDDDIDIWMPRKDYNKLIEIFNAKMADTPYIAIDPCHNEAQHSFVKIGDKRTIKYEPEYKYKNGGGYIDIDIFPLDGQPASDKEFNDWYDKLYREYELLFYKNLVLKTKPIEQRIRIIAKRLLRGGFKNKMSYYKKAILLHTQYDFDNSKFVGAIESIWNSRKNRYKKEWFNNITKLQFEDTFFNVPQNYHEILSTVYGDYMKLPPEIDRVPLHKHNTFWRDK